MVSRTQATFFNRTPMKLSEIDIAVIEKYPGNVFHVTIKSGTEVTLEAAERLI